MVAPGPHDTAAVGEMTRWDGASAQSLAQALALPAINCVETDAIGLGTSGIRRAASGRRLGLTVTTRSVYRLAIAKVFVTALQTRLVVSPDLHQRVHTAVQEAMMNAMLHGNLGLDAGIRDDLRALTTSRDMIEVRLASEPVARNAIRVEANWTRTMLHVVIRDSGGGFTKNELPSEHERLAAGRVGSGRGLMILETLSDRVSLSRGGTTIKLGFWLSPKA